MRDLAGPGGQPADYGGAEQNPSLVARETLKLADRVSAGEFVFVGPPLKEATYFPNSPVTGFLHALPAGVHIVHSAEMQGFGGLFPVEVDVFQPTAPEKS